ncbi:N-acetyltransferase [bacterium]|nr:N-acetyltransferase [bacterium]
MASLLSGPAYRIVTDRLVVRCWNPEDAPLLKAAIDDSIAHLRPFMAWALNEPEELEKKIERIRVQRAKVDRGEDFVYGIFSDDERRVVGGTGLHPRVGEGALEIGYWIHAAEIGQGYATEVSAALTKVGFEICGVKRMEIHCDPRNLASANVARKLGYTYEATLRQRYHYNGEEWTDMMFWTMFAEDYPSSPAAKTKIQAYDAAARGII